MVASLEKLLSAEEAVEERRSQRREVPVRFDVIRPKASEPDEGLRRCLDICWERCLSRAERTLLRRYDEMEATGRQTLAAKQGLTRNALRIKVYHLRAKLRACVHACVEEGLPPK